MSRPLHERVATRVARSRVSIRTLAVRSGWSERRLKRLLRGDTELSAQDMEVLSMAIGVPVGDLYLEPLGAK
jgi:transcriptional regulator with XRE-family HTH domain